MIAFASVDQSRFFVITEQFPYGNEVMSVVHLTDEDPMGDHALMLKTFSGATEILRGTHGQCRNYATKALGLVVGP